MPTAVFKAVYTVSSEDSNHTGNSLINIQPGKKWRTKEPGEKSAYIVLQLDSPQTITGIDIGNEHSAFIEVLVGKTGYGPEDFQEILITCSFMTPIESKNSSNINRVRCFSKPALVESVTNEKWDLIKIMCTQPFNKHVQYGISLIKVHVANENKEKPEKKSLVPEKFLTRKASTDSNSDKPSSLDTSKLLAGRFRLRDEDSPDSESESSTSLFRRWKDSKSKRDTMSTAAAIRAASSPSALKKDTECLKPQKIQKRMSLSRNSEDSESASVLDRNRNDLLFGAEDDIPNEKLEKKISADKERIKKTSETLQAKIRKVSSSEVRIQSSSTDDTDKQSKVEANHYSKPSSSKAKVETNHHSKASSSKLRDESFSEEKPKGSKPSIVDTTPKTVNKRLSTPPTHSAKKPKKVATPEKVYKPFNKLLEGVTLAISGIQNPDRANLRNLALSLGARYKADWDSTCTHLICAFKNTPKYVQVKKANGKIITRKWIENCHSMKKRLPWRRYALDGAEKDQPESDSEIFDISEKPSNPRPVKVTDTTLSYYDLGDDQKEDENAIKSQLVSSGSDTEDELIKVQTNFNLMKTVLYNTMAPIVPKANGKSPPDIETKLNLKKSSEKVTNEDDIFDVSTDEEEYTKLRKAKSAKSLNFFCNKKFLIDANIGAIDKIKLQESIVQFDGGLTRKVSHANYIIANDSIAVPSTFEGEQVSPLWIYECADLEKLLSTNRYLLTKI